MTTQILLIRHGETPWNREERIQGQKDVDLSPVGEEQARLLGRRLTHTALHAAYASDSLRAFHTAQIALQGINIPLEVSAELRERNFGSWEGQRWPEIREKFPLEAARFHEDSVGFAMTGGETWNQMQQRVFQKVGDIAGRHPEKTVAIFTHGGPCKAAILAALDLPARQWPVWVASNASIQRLIFESSTTGRSLWKLAGFNDISHLGAGDFLADPSAVRLEPFQEA